MLPLPATAIYGARGANGVILVTTKRENKIGGTISYDNYFSIGTLPKKIPLLNSEKFLMVEDTAFQNAEKYDPEGFAAGKYQDPALKRTDPTPGYLMRTATLFMIQTGRTK